MTATSDELMISADSHVVEDPQMWVKKLPSRFKDVAPVFPERGSGQRFQAQEGGWDPIGRLEKMAEDGVCQEILYPSLAMDLFSLTDAKLQEACFSVYNDYIIEFCSESPERLFGAGLISAYDMKTAIAELTRCHAAGLVSGQVWHVPPDDLGFDTAHYDPLWEVAQDLQMPISIHTVTGAPYPHTRLPRISLLDDAKWHDHLMLRGADAMADLIVSGVFERFPNLQFVLVENQASWIPYVLKNWDRMQLRKNRTPTISAEPSSYFESNFRATFYNDAALGYMIERWGANNLMWGNDFPHTNSPWPHSREVIDRDFGHVSAEIRHRITVGNVAELYKLPSLAAV